MIDSRMDHNCALGALAGRSPSKLEQAKAILGDKDEETYAIDNQDESQLQALFESASYNRGPITASTEVAHTVLYLMGNGYTTESTLFPDGGYILR